jgi:hypothetical protein
MEPFLGSFLVLKELVQRMRIKATRNIAPASPTGMAATDMSTGPRV